MIVKHRLFERRTPSRDAKLFIICCEGNKREPQYFTYFQEISSNIRLEIIKPESDSNNSPTGLFDQAVQELCSDESTFLEYELTENDEVWFVIDTDSWGEKILELRKSCSKKNWHVAQSNPCFEVWLYYHKFKEKPNFVDMHLSAAWKEYIDGIFPGGFDSRKHPIFIYEAITNAKENFMSENSSPQFCSTEVCFLAEKFYPYVKEEINRARQMLSGTQSDLF